MQFRYSAAAATVLLCACLAQQTAKRPLNHNDYDGWRSIQGTQLSRDGKFIAYSLFPQEGDGVVVVRSLVTGKEHREPAGQRPQVIPQEPGTEPEARTTLEPRGVTMSFTADSANLITTTFPTKADTDKAKKEKKKPEEMPKGGLAIIKLADLDAAGVRIAEVRSFQVSENDSRFVAYLKDVSEPAARSTDAKKTELDQSRSRGSSSSSSSSAARRPRTGAPLLLRTLADGSERTFASAVEYSLTKDGELLVYAVAGRDQEKNGIFAARTAEASEPAPVLAGKGHYMRLAWDDAQMQLAFLSDREDAGARQPKSRVYVWDRKAGSATEVASAALPGFRKEFGIASSGTLRFSKDGKNLFFGTAPVRENAAASTENAEDKPRFDLWHWKDDFIQPMQKVQSGRERARTFEAVLHLATKQFVQLADRELATVSLSDYGPWALGADDREYRRLVGYEERASDTYLVDTNTGQRRLLSKKVRGTWNWSPDGRYAVGFDGKDWNCVAIPSGNKVNLTAKLPVKFFDEEDDHPDLPGSYGTPVWTKDGKYVLLYDRYDVWQVAPDGSSAKNLTDGEGRAKHVQLRYVKLNPDPRDRYADSTQPLLLRAENLDTRDTGFWRDRVDGSEKPVSLVMAAKSFGPPVKAKNANVVAMTASRFDQFPDLLVTDLSFKEMRMVSNANPQKEQLSWGTSELITFRNLDGVPLKAVLYKPDNFDPHKQYPMLIYIYERLSQNLHRFMPPAPGHNINISYYVSNGYLVLTPDIVYTIGSPGQSALKCVLPAIQAVVDKGFVNEQAIGIQGHSWGGYQIAYMVTQTTRFRAAAAGAPVANMTSAYSGIRWGSGLPRQFQYERTQSRIGGNLWTAPTKFLENSPVFMADRVKTPLMILHNDNDDAVPWQQGIEYFLALRRLGKEAYMFTYNGEPHGLRRRPNQKDYAVRLQQYFDHFLKGAARPDWMEKGIPYQGPPPAVAGGSPEGMPE